MITLRTVSRLWFIAAGMAAATSIPPTPKRASGQCGALEDSNPTRPCAAHADTLRACYCVKPYGHADRGDPMHECFRYRSWGYTGNGAHVTDEPINL